MSTQPQQPPGGTGLRVHLPANLSPIYSNFAMITHSPSEIVIDFAQVMPRVLQARVQARVVMTPLNAKLLLRALGDHLARFENQYGEIDVPEGSSLADQLFRNPPAEEPEDEP